MLRYRMKGVHCNMTNVLTFRCGVTVISKKGEGVFLGPHASLTTRCLLVAKNKITIGENTATAYGVTILTTASPNYPFNELNSIYPPISKPVTIGNNVWLCANCTILPGVTIGDYSVVAAGAVVTKDVPPHSVVAGVPARVVKQI